MVYMCMRYVCPEWRDKWVATLNHEEADNIELFLVKLQQLLLRLPAGTAVISIHYIYVLGTVTPPSETPSTPLKASLQRNLYENLAVG